MLRYLLFFILLSISCFAQNNPVAENESIVHFGNARFTILTPQLIRIEYSNNKIFIDEASQIFINRKLNTPKYSVDKENNRLIIKTKSLILNFIDDNKVFNDDNLNLEFELNSKKVIWKPSSNPDGNLKGTTRTLDGIKGSYVELENGLISKDGWSLIDDSKSLLFDDADWQWIKEKDNEVKENLDLYFFGYGHDYKKCLLDFTKVAGKIPMPPRYAFGYWWSRYWSYSESELKDLVKQFRMYDIPIDVLIIDMDWHKTFDLYTDNPTIDEFGERVGWTGYTWDDELFPNYKKFLKWTDKEKLKVSLNLHPASGIASTEKSYNLFANKFGFDTTGQKNIPFLISDKKWVNIYFNYVLEPYEKDGIDFWWLDWQQWLQNKQIKSLSNTWWLNYTFFSNMERQGVRRPMLFHRWGGLGNHRYQIGFSGDAFSDWESLAYQPYFTSTASNVGYGYWSHDIGGHIRSVDDPELYLRWIQYGVFSPILRTHSTKNSLMERRFWKFGDFFPIMKDAVELRYTLAPYIYNASRYAYDTGVSMCRPMYYDFPEDKEAYKLTEQYFFGNDLIVSPVTKKQNANAGLVMKSVWLPKGKWFGLHSAIEYKGDRTIEEFIDLDEIPVYAKAGSIIPLYPKIKNLQDECDKIIFKIIPGDYGLLNYYEDDGTTSDYKSGKFIRTKIEQKSESKKKIQIVVNRSTGRIEDFEKTWFVKFELPNTYPVKKILLNDKEIELEKYVRYKAKELSNEINLGELEKTKNYRIEIEFEEHEKSLSGYKKKFKRFKKALSIYKIETNAEKWGPMPDELLSIHEIETKIENNPKQINKLLTMFDENLKKSIDFIVGYEELSKQIKEKIVYLLEYKKLIPAIPLIKIDDSGGVNINHNEKTKIYYTLDGSEPSGINGSLHQSSLHLAKSSTIKAIAVNEFGFRSFSSEKSFTKSIIKKIDFDTGINVRYPGDGKFSLLDGLTGTEKEYRKHWMGFEDDVEIFIELKEEVKVSEIGLRFLEWQKDWIFLPEQVEIKISVDGKNYTKVLNENIERLERAEDNSVFIINSDRIESPFRFIKIKINQVKEIPNWHLGKGNKAWIFIDEIIFN